MRVEVNGTWLWFDGHFPWLDVPDRYWALLGEFVTTTSTGGTDA